MYIELDNCAQNFTSNIEAPNAIVITSGSIFEYTSIIDVLNHYNWDYGKFSTEDIDISKHFHQLTKLVTFTKLLILADLSFDTAIFAGIALKVATPILVYIKPTLVNIPATIRCADGICCGIDDLTLFFDTYNSRKYLGSIDTRIISALTQIKNTRF